MIARRRGGQAFFDRRDIFVDCRRPVEPVPAQPGLLADRDVSHVDALRPIRELRPCGTGCAVTLEGLFECGSVAGALVLMVDDRSSDRHGEVAASGEAPRGR